MDKVVHFEIPSDDIKRARKFYSQVFNWEVEDYPLMDYTILRTGPVDEERMPKEAGFINGGMMKKNSKIKSPVITIAVKSIDETIKIIEKNGGRVIETKMPVGDMGFTAYFKDSEGNVIGLWENRQ